MKDQLKWKKAKDRKNVPIAMVDFPGLGCELYAEQIELMIKELQEIRKELGLFR